VEVIVVDDASTDDTLALLELLSKEDRRVRYHAKPKNGGACESRNIAIRAAKGEFITGLDDDDYFLPNHIERLLSRFLDASNKSHNSHVAVFPTLAVEVKADLREMHQPKGMLDKRDLKVRNAVGNQILARKGTFIEAGLFDESLPAWQDYDMWIRIAALGTVFLKADGPTYVYEDLPATVKISTGSSTKLLKAYERVSSNAIFEDLKDKLILKLNYYRYPQVRMSARELLKYFSAGIFVAPTKTYLKKLYRNIVPSTGNFQDSQ